MRRGCEQCDQMLGIISSPTFTKSFPKSIQHFYWRSFFQIGPKSNKIFGLLLNEDLSQKPFMKSPIRSHCRRHLNKCPKSPLRSHCRRHVNKCTKKWRRHQKNEKIAFDRFRNRGKMVESKFNEFTFFIKMGHPRLFFTYFRL